MYVNKNPLLYHNYVLPATIELKHDKGEIKFYELMEIVKKCTLYLNNYRYIYSYI